MVEQKNKASQKFPKTERLSSKRLIKELFDKGSSFYVPPFKVIYLPIDDHTASSHQVLITVPKRNFKKAVHRNLIKRRIREVYRKNKHVIPGEDFYLLIGYIYIGKEIAEYKLMENKLIETLLRLKAI